MAGREDRFRWKPGDVKIYKNLEELKREIAKEGGVFIPSRPEKEKKEETD